MGKTSTDLHQLYEKPGKRQFTKLVLDLAEREGLRTLGFFWGGGGDSRLAVAAGFDVLAVDNDESLAAAMAEDGLRVGYRTFAGNARKVRERRDMWHADFMNTPNPDNFATIRHLAKHTDKWLAVTVATDHIKNPEMQGESLMATLPAWLTFAAEGFTLEYFAWYKRNAGGLRMWTALLQRKSGKGTAHQVLPVQIAWSVSACRRGYWASRELYLSGLMRHKQSPRSPREKANDAARYLRNRQEAPDRERHCSRCGSSFVTSKYARGRPRAYCESCRGHARIEYRQAYHFAHYVAKGLTDRTCAECGAQFQTVQYRAYCTSACAYKAERRLENARRRARSAAVSGTAAEAISSEEAA